MEKQRTFLRNRLWLLILLIMLVGFVAVGSAIWGDYRDKIMLNYKEQLLLTSKSLAENMNLSLTEYQNDLEFLSAMTAEETNKQVYQMFLKMQSKYECNLIWEDENGAVSESVYDLPLKDPVFISQIDAQKSVWQYTGADGGKYLVFKKKLEHGGNLGLVVDEEQYYEQLISDIHIGTNGYVVVKNSTGTVVMHPVKEQWGIHVIEGRKEMYPGLDFESLDTMIQEQQIGKSGISEYYSYWWSDEALPRVKKISTYAPAWLGEDFWIISAVVDYDDFYLPIEKGFRSLMLLFAAAVVLFFGMFFYSSRLIWQQKRAVVEIEALKELNERMEELHKGQEMLAHQQRLQVMGTMTGGIAHEFNNFLTPIMGHAELLMMELEEGSDAYDSAAEIYEASEKAGDMVRQISSLSRKNVETVYRVIRIDRLLTRALKMIESICPANVQLEKHIKTAEEAILGNATQINQVLLNICVNAFYAMKDKEGRLAISAECVPWQDLKQEEAIKRFHFTDNWEKYLCIEISDNGCGMNEEVLRQAFNPFFTTKKAGEGTGLGLALAEQIITSHKGGIYAKSVPGKGTIFRILLPATEYTEMPELSVKSEEKTLTLLIADDNAKVLQLLTKNFQRLGIAVITCSGKKELCAYLDKYRADILVVDESLEDGSGIEFCMAMQGRYPDMLKLVMVDYFTKTLVEAKHNGIIDGYVIKPVSDAAILEVVRACSKA